MATTKILTLPGMLRIPLVIGHALTLPGIKMLGYGALWLLISLAGDGEFHWGEWLRGFAPVLKTATLAVILDAISCFLIINSWCEKRTLFCLMLAVILPLLYLSGKYIDKDAFDIFLGLVQWPLIISCALGLTVNIIRFFSRQCPF